MMAPIKLEENEAAARARLADSLSASFPSQALSKAFEMDPDESDGDKDPLSSSCYAEIRLDKVKLEDLDSDDELTSLSWLQDTDLLRNIRMDSCTSPMDEEEQKENESGLQNSGIYGVPHPPHVPYNPQKHVNSKPPYSFSCLIFMSIEDSPDKKLPVKDIYNWILTHFPYFQNAPTGWKNSVRHNLSLNKCFKKVEKDRCSNIGKGSLWMIDPDFRPNLLQALRKTPYHPYHQLQMFNNTPNTPAYGIVPGSEHKPYPLQPRYNVNTPSPHLFPFLSKRLAQSSYDVTNTNTPQSSISVSDIDVANTLVSLKRAAENRRPQQRSRSPSPPEFGSEREKELLRQKKFRSSRSDSPIVCHALPSDDHSYCITEEMIQPASSKSPESSIDEEYEFGNNDKSLSDDDDCVYSESDYDEEGWSEEEELYNKEKLKLSRSSGSNSSSSSGAYSNPPSTRRVMQPLIIKPNQYKMTTTTSGSVNKVTSAESPAGSLVHRIGRPPGTGRRVERHSVVHRVGRPWGTGHRGTHPTEKKPKRVMSPPPQTFTIKDEEEDEDVKLAEGANALLNLAGIKTAHIVPLRSISPSNGTAVNNNNNNNVVKKMDFLAVNTAGKSVAMATGVKVEPGESMSACVQNVERVVVKQEVVDQEEEMDTR